MGKKDKGKEKKRAKTPPSVRDLLRVGPEFDLGAQDPRRVVAGPGDKETARAAALALEPEIRAAASRISCFRLSLIRDIYRSIKNSERSLAY